VGEPSSTVVTPAATNAIFNAVDARAQHMSITREVLRKAMAKA
tara:strand:- start:1369 stop:1497 length:129 start_codon:yes stop_codon:yes gene_type:complete